MAKENQAAIMTIICGLVPREITVCICIESILCHISVTTISLANVYVLEEKLPVFYPNLYMPLFK